MDVWVNFTHATKWQAEGIFKCFFPYKPSPTTSAASTPPTPPDSSQRNLPLPKCNKATRAIPMLSEEEISELAKRFAEAIPEDELSVRTIVGVPAWSRDGARALTVAQVAALQGYLLKNKTRPRECVDEVDEWSVKNFPSANPAGLKCRRRVIQERLTREKLKKEKEEVCSRPINCPAHV